MVSLFYSCDLQCNSPLGKTYSWEVQNINPFDELLLSWNALRPLKGHFVILASIYIKRWSPWLLFAVWGADAQYSFHETTFQAPVRSFQDQIEILDDQLATGFRIRIEACAGASLEQFYSLQASTAHIKTYSPFPNYSPDSSLQFPVPGLSQLTLPHPRSKSFCSPASVAAALSYIRNEKTDPLKIAKGVYDAGFDIYGNWSFNIAEAFAQLGSEWRCWHSRTNGLDSIWPYLKQGLPVVASIKGSLAGSLMPYANGHLVVIKGYDAVNHRILCMDPAFPSNEETLVSYNKNEFLQAWKRRHFLAYFFCPRAY